MKHQEKKEDVLNGLLWLMGVLRHCVLMMIRPSLFLHLCVQELYHKYSISNLVSQGTQHGLAGYLILS